MKLKPLFLSALLLASCGGGSNAPAGEDAPKYLGMGLKQKEGLSARKKRTETMEDCDSFPLHIYFSNPNQYEILSFVINGAKFSSYMFENGSNMEDVIVTMAHDRSKEEETFTIEQIKYVNGTAISDVPFQGERELTITFTKTPVSLEIPVICSRRDMRDAFAKVAADYDRENPNSAFRFNVEYSSNDLSNQIARNVPSHGLVIGVGDLTYFEDGLDSFLIPCGELLTDTQLASYDRYALAECGDGDTLLTLPVGTSPLVCYYRQEDANRYLGDDFGKTPLSYDELVSDLKEDVLPNIDANSKKCLAIDMFYDVVQSNLDEAGKTMFVDKQFLGIVDEAGKQSINDAILDVKQDVDVSGLIDYQNYPTNSVVDGNSVCGISYISSAAWVYGQGVEVGSFPLINEAGHFLHHTIGAGVYGSTSLSDEMKAELGSVLHKFAAAYSFESSFMTTRKDILASTKYQEQLDLYVPIYKQIGSLMQTSEWQTVTNTYGHAFETVWSGINSLVTGEFTDREYQNFLEEVRKLSN